MSIFTTILDKLGLHKDKPAATAGAAPSADKGEKDNAAAKIQPARTNEPARPAATPVAPSTFTPTANFHPNAISEVDVVKKLEQMAAGSGLDWKVSIVDLLKVLGIDSSREARNELATELGCPADLMKDSAKMNVWLHKTVLTKIAENGGNIPQSLLN